MDRQTDVKNGKESKKGKKIKPIFKIMIFVAVLMAVSAVLSFWLVTSDKKAVNAELSKEEIANGISVDIPLNSSTESIAKLLNKQGVIKHPFIFKVVSKIKGYDSTYQSGVHILPKDPARDNLFKMVSKYEQVMKILCSKPNGTTVTIPEGFTLKQIAQRLSDKKVIDANKFMQAVNNEKFNYKFLESIPSRSNRLEGYLFPDTYEFGINIAEKDVISKMLKRFDDKFNNEYYEKAKKLNMTVDQVIILASIIEREAKVPEDRKIIAGVFYNRLNSKDPVMRKLQSCATIQYILFKRDGKYKEKLYEQDTKINDPYNTYQIEGLPPGPICSPGKDSIDAAFNPMATDYMFFVAKNDGSHQFSKTFKEHEAAVKKYGLN